MKNKTHFLVPTLLSLSLLTVMAGAAIAPALGVIKAHFNHANQLLVQFIVSIPALFIIITNLVFLPISRRFSTRSIAIVALLLYIVSGTGCFWIENLSSLLLLRALLGISVGLIMPLSTGLFAYYYPPEQQARLMGLSAAMNQMGGVVATLLAGLLATISWNYAFLVYSMGLIAFVMVLLWLPAEKIGSENKRGKSFEPKQLLKFHPSVIGMLLLMAIFFVYPTNFAITASNGLGLNIQTITLIMVGLDVVAFFAGLVFGRLMQAARKPMKYVAPIGFLLGYTLLLDTHSTATTLLGSLFIGIANGIGVPYLLTIASIKGGKNAATTVMPLLSAALYAGQFLSPIVVTPLSRYAFTASDTVGTYKIAIALCLCFLLQTLMTRKFHSLPPSQLAHK